VLSEVPSESLICRHHHLGIPFDQLKLKMTGDSPMSMGKSIQELRPEADAKSKVKRAEQQAKEEIRQAEAARNKSGKGEW
jgi:hypothetical protein